VQDVSVVDVPSSEYPHEVGNDPIIGKEFLAHAPCRRVFLRQPFSLYSLSCLDLRHSYTTRPVRLPCPPRFVRTGAFPLMVA